MPSKVFWGSPRQARLTANETLPAKLDLILNELNLRDRVKGENVAIKLHVGSNIVYSTVHPVFVQKVVQGVKDGGGHPFVVDLNWGLHAFEQRGYLPEAYGCPVYHPASIDEKFFFTHLYPYKNIREWQVVGMVEDASFLINFAHAKGHPSCAYGGAIKNIALGCMAGPTRSAMHDAMQFDPYWFPEKCPDDATRQKIMEACPFGALVQDKADPNIIHMHFEECNQCGRCLQAAPPGSLMINAVNFAAFQEACAISTQITLSTFEPGKTMHLCLANQITPMCDCFGFTSMAILPDAGIFGSDDIVALDQAVIDKLAEAPLIEENVPTAMEVHTRRGHPLQWVHGPLKDPNLAPQYLEKLGVGTRQYKLVDVFPVVKVERSTATYIPAQ
jgi:uncharacterized protein